MQNNLFSVKKKTCGCKSQATTTLAIIYCVLWLLFWSLYYHSFSTSHTFSPDTEDPALLLSAESCLDLLGWLGVGENDLLFGWCGVELPEDDKTKKIMTVSAKYRNMCIILCIFILYWPLTSKCLTLNSLFFSYQYIRPPWSCSILALRNNRRILKCQLHCKFVGQTE